MADEAIVSMSSIRVIIDASDVCKDTNNNQNEHDQPAQFADSSRAASILLRLHPGYFTMTISLCSQALLWKMLSQKIGKSHSENSILSCPSGLPRIAFLLLWWLAFGNLILLSLLYCLRCIFHFQMLKQEFSNHVGLNYLFAPWVSGLLLIQSLPFVIPKTMFYNALWWFLVLPVIFLDLKLYGQWFTTEKRFLSIAANPTSQVSIIANMVAAWTAAQMGWKESALCLFAVGAVHYFVVFITLYQRLSGAGSFPAILRPVFLLFAAAPSAACLALDSILETFNIACKMLFSLSLFLFISLACRPALFKKSVKRYNVAWWAFSFPTTFLALASSEYARHIKDNVVAPGLALCLAAFSVLVFLGLMISTALNAQTLLQKTDPFLSLTSDLRRT